MNHCGRCGEYKGQPKQELEDMKLSELLLFEELHIQIGNKKIDIGKVEE